MPGSVTDYQKEAPAAESVPCSPTIDAEHGVRDTSNPGPPPDGGREAWLVVLGSFLALGATFGIINSYGVFQSYYTSSLLKDSSSSTISFIGAMQLAIMYGSGPVIGKIFDAHGLRILYPLGTLLSVLGLMLLSLCQQDQTYQFFLVQAVMFPGGCTLIFTPSLAVIGHWFSRRRAFALGIAGSGSAAFGTVFPILLARLIPRIGFPWAVRVLAFAELACMLIAIVCVKTRFKGRGRVSVRGVVDLHGFKDKRYTIAAIGSFLFFYAIFIPYFYIQDYATFRGVDVELAGYLLSLINITSFPARIIPGGLLADKFGVLQMIVPTCVASGTIVLALWLPARGTAPIVIFSLVYGLASGAYVSLLPAYIATLSPVEKFGARLGSVYIFVAIACLVGPPTAGAFVPTFTQANFTRLIVFTGVMLLGGGVCFIIAYFLPGPAPSPAVSIDNEKE